MIFKYLRQLPRRYAIAAHNRAIAGILRTAPAGSDRAGPIYAGMTCHRDALCWLVAVKSIVRGVGPGRYVAVDDGSLTAADKECLATHLPGLRILSAKEIDTGNCPRGGMWERLMVMLDLAAEGYVVQVDSDLVALGTLAEVVEAVRHNRGFTLSGERDVAVRSLGEAAAAARQQTYPHIQHETERLLDTMADASAYRYVRGCAGFTGFPRGSSRALAVQFSDFMAARLGARWRQWGTEQITSNFIIANSHDAMVLPWEAYPAFERAGQDLSQASLVHFIGPARYQGGAFTRASRSAIAALGG